MENWIGQSGINALEPDTSPTRRRFHDIHRALRRRIALLEYPPGTRLNVDELAGEFKVSRTPIRSVLQRLEYQGLVITRHGVGTTVTDIDFSHLREATVFRMRLAELIGELSPRAPSPEVIQTLAQACEECRHLFDHMDLKTFGRIDISLHEGICSLIGNSLLLQVYDDLFYRTIRMWTYFLPQRDWHSEVSFFLAHIEATHQAMQRDDTRAVGFLVRNAVSAAVIRLDDLLSMGEQATVD